jgi:hypothetical protein
MLEQKIGFIQSEYNSNWVHASSTLAAAISLLGFSGYSGFLIRRKGLYNFDYSLYGEFFRNSNFLAVSNCRLKDVASLIKN